MSWRYLRRLFFRGSCSQSALLHTHVMCSCFSQAGPSFFLVHLQDVCLWSIWDVFDFYFPVAFSVCSLNKSSVSKRIQRDESVQVCGCWWTQKSQTRQKYIVSITVIWRHTVTAGDQGHNWTSWLHDLHLQDLFRGWKTGTEREFFPLVKSRKHYNEFCGRGTRLVVWFVFNLIYNFRLYKWPFVQICFPLFNVSE